MEHNIKVSDKSIYIGETPESAIAVIDYYLNRNGIIVATHTEVSRQLRGQGIAFLLFEKLIEVVKEKQTTILPYCSYIAEQLKKEEFAPYLYQKY